MSRVVRPLRACRWSSSVGRAVDPGRDGARRRFGESGTSPGGRRGARARCRAASTPRSCAKAEAYLLTEAGHFGPQELRRLGHGLLEVVAPEIADEAEYQRLVAEEKRAHAATQLSFHRRGDGSTDIRVRVPDPVANRVRTYVDAYTSPRRGPLGEVDRSPWPADGVRRSALCWRTPRARLPQHGGTATSVMVMLDLDRLRDGTGFAATSAPATGSPPNRPAGWRVRRTSSRSPWAGRAKSSTSAAPDGSSPPRSARRWSLRDRRCTADGCDMPAAWCEAHHHRAALGPRAARPISLTASCSCRFTTPRPRTGLGHLPPPQRSTTFHRRT